MDDINGMLMDNLDLNGIEDNELYKVWDEVGIYSRLQFMLYLLKEHKIWLALIMRSIYEEER